MNNARKASKIRTLEECLLKEQSVKLQMKNGTRMSDDESRDVGLYNKLKAWKPTSG